MNKIKKGLLALGLGLYSYLPATAERDVYARNTSELEQALEIDSSTEHLNIILSNNIYEPSFIPILENKSLIGETPLDLFDNLRVNINYEPITGVVISNAVDLKNNSKLSNIIFNPAINQTAIVFSEYNLNNIIMDNLFIKQENTRMSGGLTFFTNSLNDVTLYNSYISTGNDGAILLPTSIDSGEITLENNIFHNNNIALWGNSTALFNAHNNVFMSKDYNIEVAKPPYELDFENNWWYRPKQSLRDGNTIEYELITSEDEIRDTINVREKSTNQNIDVFPFYKTPFFEVYSAVENWDMY